MINRIRKGSIAAMIAVMLLLSFTYAFAGIPVGTWRSHQAYHDASFSTRAFGQIFVLSDGSLYSYDPQDNAVYTYDKVGGLSDTDISYMAYCEKENALVLIYSNADIDVLYDDMTVYNFTDFKNFETGDKTVNGITVKDDIIYLSSSYGLVAFNVGKLEISASYIFDSPVLTCTFLGDSILCGTENGIYVSKTDNNLLDKSSWKMFRDIKFIDLFTFDGRLMGRSYDRRIWTIDRNTAALKNVMDHVTDLSVTSDRLVLVQDTAVNIYSSLDSSLSITFKGENVRHVLYENNSFWISRGRLGISEFEISDSSVTCKVSGILPDSPRRKWFHSVSWPSQEKMLAISGTQNYSGIDYPGTVMIYENGRWNYLEDDISGKTGLKYINLTEAVQDPYDDDHYFIGSARQGVYEFNDGKFIRNYNFNNSGLTTIIPEHPYDFVSVSTLQYDRNGNLWMANNEVDTIIKILKTDGKWTGLYYSDIAGLPTLRQMKFDKNGYVWINSSRYNPGMICIDWNGTLEKNSDDRIRFSGSSFTNQDGTTQIISDISCYEFDLNGEMWIGTNIGIFVLKDPDSFISDSKPVFERVKIPRNDGTGLADYLFDGVYVTSMYIDQGNRKWIGTLNNGVFLISDDGLETIEHFTTENSPLPSDYILSISENGADGSIFIGTNLGLIEYGGTARDPENSLRKSDISVYPNPVMPGYEGYVTITDLTEKSTVRIIGTDGQLVCQGVSNGGSFSWNLCTSKGETVSSGIYHAIVTDSENSTSESVSITVIR